MHIWRRDWESNPGPLVHSDGEEPLRYLLPLLIHRGVNPSSTLVGDDFVARQRQLHACAHRGVSEGDVPPWEILY